jgi:hypothetical protein
VLLSLDIESCGSGEEGEGKTKTKKRGESVVASGLAALILVVAGTTGHGHASNRLSLDLANARLGKKGR